MMKPISYTWLIGGALATAAVFAAFAYSSRDPSAVAAPSPALIQPTLELTPTSKLPSFADLVESTGFIALKGPKLPPPVIAEPPPDPPPLATVAAAEATAPKSPDPCEVTVRRLARTTVVPVKETIFDDIEAKYELIRVNDNQRFLAIRSACVKRDHPRRG